MALAEELGVSEYVDEDGYFVDSYYEGKSGEDLSGDAAVLVDGLTGEELDALVEALRFSDDTEE